MSLRVCKHVCVCMCVYGWGRSVVGMGVCVFECVCRRFVCCCFVVWSRYLPPTPACACDISTWYKIRINHYYEKVLPHRPVRDNAVTVYSGRAYRIPPASQIRPGQTFERQTVYTQITRPFLLRRRYTHTPITNVTPTK